MFSKGKLMLLYSESLIHPGAGAGVGAIDLPIQRERVTNWPIIHGSGIKGALRDHFETAGCKNDELFVVFGPDPGKEDGQQKRGSPADHSGSISVSDARVILFPVRSLRGTFAYITCPLALTRLKRDLEALEPLGSELLTDGLKEAAQISVARNQALLPAGNSTGAGQSQSQKGVDGKKWESDILIVMEHGKQGQTGQHKHGEARPKKQVVMEELALDADTDGKVDKLADWLTALCNDSPPWLRLRERLCVVHDDVFRDFVEFSTEVITRNKIDDEVGTVIEGALWNEECLPRETLLYSLLLACKPRKREAVDGIEKDDDVLKYITSGQPKGRKVAPQRIWLGGDITVGRGILRTIFV